ncbi:MAG: hypothetical protein M3N16_01615 [Actinomycetota bacterium]|nr:hypothetical protein [Actinomycetota bacterium]
MTARTAHPYRDTHVIDSRVRRANQAVIGSLALLAAATGLCLGCEAYVVLARLRGPPRRALPSLTRWTAPCSSWRSS